MAKGKLKKVFPGGNTSVGFFSLYDNIIAPDATRIFCIKGGPGVGKSTFMRFIGEVMLEKGYDVEFHCCSSDNGSLDGVCIPQLRIALLDGTAPHVVDPKNPGAVDEIIHLGDYWDEAKMRAQKNQVLKINARVGRLFKMAYSQLREAKVIHDEWESYITECMDFPKVNQVSAEINNDFFAGVTSDYRYQAKDRHLFATAITPEGPMNYLDTILQDTEELYILKGAPGTGKSSIVKLIAQQAKAKGLDTEIYHCALEPLQYDHLVVPALGKAIINASAPIIFNPTDLKKVTKIVEYNLSDFIQPDLLAIYTQDVCSAQERFWQAFNRACGYIKQAKATHDEMETYYVPAMNFTAINAKRDEILARILQYAKEN